MSGHATDEFKALRALALADGRCLDPILSTRRMGPTTAASGRPDAFEWPIDGQAIDDVLRICMNEEPQ